MPLDSVGADTQHSEVIKLTPKGRFSFQNLQKYIPIDIHVIILAIWLPLLLLIKGGWGFSPTGTLDPWFYLGYMLDLPNHERAFPGTYFGTRLPLILPGYGLYQLFPPIVANYILHVGVYYIGVFSIYLILKNTLNRRTALLTALLMGVYGWYLSATGWDYVDGTGIAYLTLTLLMLLYAAKVKRWAVAMFAAGAFSAALFTTNLFLLVFAPFLAVFYLFANLKYRKNNLLFSLGLFVFGGLAAVTLFGLAYKLMTGHFIYFYDSLGAVKSAFASPNQWISTTAWYLNATWLVFPVITVVVSIFYLVLGRIAELRRDNQENNNWLIFFQIWSISLFVIFLGLQISPYSPVLQLSYYTSYLIPATFLIIGSMLADPLAKLTPRQFMRIGISTFLLLCLSHIAFPSAPTGEEFAGNLKLLLPSMPYVSLLVPLTFLSAGFLLVVIKTYKVQVLLLALLCFSIGNAMASSNAQSSGDSEAYSVTIKSAQAMKIMMPNEDGYFWYDAYSAFGGIYTDITSTNIWGYRLINDNFPSLVNWYNKRTDFFYVGQKLVLFSADDTTLDQARSALKTLDMGIELVAQKQITENNISFSINIVTITRPIHNLPSF